MLRDNKGVKNDQGTVFSATEDWGPQGGKSKGYHKYLCDDSLKAESDVPPCTQRGARVAGTNSDGTLWGRPINISWEVQQQGGQLTYYGNVNGTKWSVQNPKSYDGQVIFPGRYHSGSKKANDPTRIRVDGSKSSNLDQGLAVYPLGSGGYRSYGDLGYISENARDLFI